MARRIKLRRYGLQNVAYRWLTAFRLRVEVVASENMDPHVFLFLRGPVDPYSGEPVDVFSAVCGPADLAEYPALEPDPKLPDPFFRLDSFEIDLRAAAQAEEAWLATVAGVATLIKALDLLDGVGVLDELWLGTPAAAPPASESLSASTSLSESQSSGG